MKRFLFFIAIIGMSMIATTKMTAVAATEMTNANEMTTVAASDTAATGTVYLAKSVGVDLGSGRQCRDFLNSHRMDTLISEEESVVLLEDFENFHKGDTVPQVMKVFFDNNGALTREYYYINIIPVYQEEVVVNRSLADSLAAKAAETTVAYEMTNDGSRKDVKYYEYHYGDETGKIPAKYADKDGWYFTGNLAYHAGTQTYGFSGTLGFGYEGRMLLGEVIAGPERSRYSENAEHAGKKYWALRTEASLMLQPVKFGPKDRAGKKFDQHRLWVGGGAVFRYYATDSKVAEDGGVLKSKGSEISFGIKARYEYRIAYTGYSLYFEGFYGPKKTIVQNQHGGPTHDTFGFRVGALIGINRHKN